MPAKKSRKKAKTKKKPTRRSRASRPASKADVHSEFLVFVLPETLKVGSPLRLIHVAKTFDLAEKHIETMSGSKANYYSILERKAVLLRAPVTTTTIVKRNVVTE